MAGIDRSTVKVKPDGTVTVKGRPVGWVRLKTVTDAGTGIYEYGGCGGPAVGVGYSLDGAAMECANDYIMKGKKQ